MKKHRVTVIRKSCLTGRAVWIYVGPSYEAARIAYHKACRKELERMRQWGQSVARRCANVARILADCTSALPLAAEMTAAQKEAARRLLALRDRRQPCSSEFFDHVVAEKRRQESASRRWRGARGKWFARK